MRIHQLTPELASVHLLLKDNRAMSQDAGMTGTSPAGSPRPWRASSRQLMGFEVAHGGEKGNQKRGT